MRPRFFQSSYHICRIVAVNTELTGDRDLIESITIIEHGQYAKLNGGEIVLAAFFEEKRDVNLVQAPD